MRVFFIYFFQANILILDRFFNFRLWFIMGSTFYLQTWAVLKRSFHLIGQTAPPSGPFRGAFPESIVSQLWLAKFRRFPIEFNGNCDQLATIVG